MQYWRVPEYHRQNWRVPEAVPPLMETHDDGRQIKGDKAQTRPARRTPPLRETHEGRQMKGDKAQTRPERRTPPLRETHEGKQLKGDTCRETHEGKQGTDKFGEADTTTQGDT